MGLFSKSKADKIPKGTAYVIWSCLEDEHSCPTCKAMEGTCWSGATDIQLPPLTSCTSPEECRCMCIYVSTEETGASDTADFIRSRGGKASAGQMTHYFEVSKKHRVVIPESPQSHFELSKADKLLQEATAKKKSGDMNGAIESLRKAYKEMADGSVEYSIEPYLRLPLYLQEANRSDEAWTEFNRLLDWVDTAGQFQQAIKPMMKCLVYDKMRLFLQRDRKSEEAVIYGIYAYLSKVTGYHMQGSHEGLATLVSREFIEKEVSPLLKKAKREDRTERIVQLIVDNLGKLPRLDFDAIREAIEQEL